MADNVQVYDEEYDPDRGSGSLRPSGLSHIGNAPSGREIGMLRKGSIVDPK